MNNYQYDREKEWEEEQECLAAESAEAIADAEAEEQAQVEMSEQELNEKLAKWAGFEKVEYLNTSGEVCGRHWTLPDKSNGYPTLPNLPKSLDACFKWLVPKVLTEIGRCETVVLVNNAVCDAVENNGEIALALCLAIERLVDKEVKQWRR